MWRYVLEEHCLSEIKDWDYPKRSTSTKKVKETERIHKITRALESR